MIRAEPQNASVLDVFATADTVELLSKAATELIKSKKTLFEAINDVRFRNGLSRLIGEASTSSDSRRRLKAIATLERLRASLRKKGLSVQEALIPTLEEPIESSQLLSDGDDRYYIATALHLIKAEWVASYCAREVIAEQTAENARGAFAKLLLLRSATIEDALEHLAAHWTAFAKPKDDASNATARRLRRIFQALSQCLISGNVRDKGLVGESSRRLISSAFQNEKEPDSLAVLRDLANSIALFLDGLVRARLSLLLDSSIYAPLKLCRRWFPLSSWSSFVSKSKDYQSLVNTLSQAILLSAKQGIPEKGLFDALEICAGDRAAAIKVTNGIAAATVGLTAEAQTWLKTWRAPQGEPQRAEHFSADDYVARALLEAWAVRNKVGAASAQPDEAGALVTTVFGVASARGLTLIGEPGAETEYAPEVHALTGEMGSTRKIRILRPGVERVSEQGIRHVLIKAICESVLKS